MECRDCRTYDQNVQYTLLYKPDIQRPIKTSDEYSWQHEIFSDKQQLTNHRRNVGTENIIAKI